jgi:hypothetical protein
MANIDVITSPSFINRLNKKPTEHKTIREIYGKFFVGCNFENALKKFPSAAAA